jgi:hypothetical protein
VTATGNLHLLFPPIGLRLKLDRTVDRLRPCHGNIATVDHGRGVHAAGLRCCQCGQFRGWLPREGFQFLTDLTQRYGASTEPIILRDQQIGDHIMADKQYDDTNHGALFKNTAKEDPKHADYRGEVNANGELFWLNACRMGHYDGKARRNSLTQRAWFAGQARRIFGLDRRHGKL